MSTTFAGVWRQGADGHYLWVGADWNGFQAKWQDLSQQNLRLVDLETYVEGNQRRWTGVWRQGADGHYLWVGVDWNSFLAKWQELNQQSLRLVDVEVYVDGGETRWCGVWREGNDGHYLWVADWPGFLAKWQELSQMNLRLVDLDTYLDDGRRMWVGVWREGADAHYLWVNADWLSFVSKWQELSQQGLRLVDIETWVDDGEQRWGGIWREGSDAHHLWAAPDRENFLGKWNELSKSQLRLVRLVSLEAACGDDCANQVVAPTPYVYNVTADPDGPYQWPVDGTFVRPSALAARDQPFTLPFSDRSVVHWGTWRYSDKGDYHHAIDYLRQNDWRTFEVRAAAAGRVVFVGWDHWSGNTVIVSHPSGSVDDAYRTIYMHLRGGAEHDCTASWSETVPNLSGAKLEQYKAYLENTGCTEDPATREPDPDYWGTESEVVESTLLNSTVAAGDVLGWAGCTGPGGCGSDASPSHPNTHLHIFFARRNLTDDQWYFIDPYGVYGPPSCSPGVDQAVTGACARYPVTWKDGRPQYPPVPVGVAELEDGADEASAIDVDDDVDATSGDEPVVPLIRADDLGERPYDALDLLQRVTVPSPDEETGPAEGPPPDETPSDD